MADEADGLPVTSLIAEVKQALVAAGVTQANPARDLRVESVQLILDVVATKVGGGRLSFRIPFIGTELNASATRKKQDTHTINITMVPPEQSTPAAVRGPDNVQKTLIEAIQTIRMTVLSAAQGRDPWLLSDGTVDISFGVTQEGVIALGVEGELTNEATNTLRLKLAPV